MTTGIEAGRAEIEDVIKASISWKYQVKKTHYIDKSGYQKIIKSGNDEYIKRKEMGVTYKIWRSVSDTRGGSSTGV